MNPNTARQNKTFMRFGGVQLPALRIMPKVSTTEITLRTKTFSKLGSSGIIFEHAAINAKEQAAAIIHQVPGEIRALELNG